MRYFLIVITTLLLSACSIQKMADKILPEDVKTRVETDLELVLNKDEAVFDKFYIGADADKRKELDGQVAGILDGVASGPEIRRDIVGVSSNVSKTNGRTKRDYSVVYEVQTDQAFSLITLDYIRHDDNPLSLKNVIVKKSDTSPMRKGLEMAGTIGKAFLVGLLLVLGGLVFGLTRRSRRKKAAKST